jgi:hypothetical protein
MASPDSINDEDYSTCSPSPLILIESDRANVSEKPRGALEATKRWLAMPNSGFAKGRESQVVTDNRN